MYRIELSKQAKKDLSKIKKSGQKSEMNKITVLFAELGIHPREGTGKPEILKHQKGGEIWSRRVNQKDRLIYEIIEEKIIVSVISLLSHYGDK